MSVLWLLLKSTLLWYRWFINFPVLIKLQQAVASSKCVCIYVCVCVCVFSKISETAETINPKFSVS